MPRNNQVKGLRTIMAKILRARRNNERLAAYTGKVPEELIENSHRKTLKLRKHFNRDSNQLSKAPEIGTILAIKILMPQMERLLKQEELVQNSLKKMF